MEEKHFLLSKDTCISFPTHAETKYPEEVEWTSISHKIVEDYSKFKNAIVTVSWSPPKGIYAYLVTMCSIKLLIVGTCSANSSELSNSELSCIINVIECIFKRYLLCEEKIAEIIHNWFS